jgi:hypothetical protein
VNQAIGIYSKAGVLLQSASLASIFTASPGAICAVAANHQGNPTILYDAGYDRWVLTDFAWALSSDRALCIAVSNSGDPTGTWIRYQITLHPTWVPRASAIGLWTDGVFMSIDMWDGSTFNGTRVWAFDRAELYGGAPSTFYVDLPTQYRSLLPANFRGASPPVGTPEYLAAADQATSTLNIWKFAMNWVTESGTLTGPTPVTVPAYSPPPATISQMAGAGGDLLDSQGDRLIMQNQYRNLGGVESLWLTHTVGSGGDPNIAGIRWYQLDVTGQGIDSTPAQSGTYAPDSDNRWIPSLAVDGIGDMAVGYSVSSASMYPAIRYAARLVTDSPGTLGQGEATFFAGNGAQSGAGGAWGTHSSMSIDPIDDCTFWYTNMYYSTTGSSWRTRIGSFAFPECVDSALVRVSVANVLRGQYVVPAGQALTPAYPGLQGGPVEVLSSNSKSILVSEQALFGPYGTFNEVMGVPSAGLSNHYWFPWYDNRDMITWILVGNPSSSLSAHVTIKIAGTTWLDNYELEPNGIITPLFGTEQNGPVEVLSDIPVFTSERTLLGYPSGAQSFNEVLGYPNSELTNHYWFPWYDNKDMITWVLVGNPSSSLSAHVTIKIAGTTWLDNYELEANGIITPQFGIEQNGPVEVISDLPVFTSQRSVFGGPAHYTFDEVMGYPHNQLTNHYWFPWYDNSTMLTWVLVGNPSDTLPANVTIKIGGVEVSSHLIPPNGRVTPMYGGAPAGPVEVVSDIDVFTSERALKGWPAAGASFNEFMGLPHDKLADRYLFTWYDDKDMLTNIVIAHP